MYSLIGGCVSLAEVRQKQQVEVRQSKLQKKVSTFCLKLDIHSLKTPLIHTHNALNCYIL